MKSNFEKVLEFNKAFGVKTNTEPQLDIFDKDPKLVQLKLDLILEEVDEFKQAIKEKNFTEIVDGLTDILYVVYGAATAFGFDADKSFDIVHESNMSKLCDTEEDAILTVHKYKEAVPKVYDSPAYRKSECGKYFVVYNTSSNKILKSYKYTPANFSELI
jgi:predicted HAD superfamily Cof-like phosphohydrolase